MPPIIRLLTWGGLTDERTSAIVGPWKAEGFSGGKRFPSSWNIVSEILETVGRAGGAKPLTLNRFSEGGEGGPVFACVGPLVA